MTAENCIRIMRTEHGVKAFFVDEAGQSCPLDPRYDLQNHSPSGFEFGYGGSGPCQLALAICAEVLRDDKRALGVYQGYKALAIATIDRGRTDITIPFSQVMKVIQRIECGSGQDRRR